MKTLLYVTDLNNGWSDEDRLTGAYLSQYYDVHFAGIDEAARLEDDADAVLLRNTWPGDVTDAAVIDHYRNAKQELRARLQKKGIPSYNAHDGRGDMKGKAHLLELQAAGFPVIPTVVKLEEIDRLPEAAEYRVKSANGFSAWLQGNYKREELNGMDLSGCLIQPKLPFVSEISVYYVDDKVFCVARAADKAKEDMKIVAANDHIIAEAEKFRKWNRLSHGLQRIDFIEMPGGQLLLMEIEDDAPYFNVPKLPPEMQQQLFGMIHQSLEKNLEM